MTTPYRLSGTVSALTTREVPKKAGGTFTKHGIKVGTVEAELDGFRQKYRVGDVIDVAVVYNFKRWNVTGPANPADPLVPTGTAGAPGGVVPGAPPAPYTPRGGERVFPVPSGSGEMAIIRQNALTNAVKMVNDWYALNDESPDSVSAMADEVIQNAYKFQAFSSGRLDEKAAEQLAKDTEK